jgi:hypothetical protein
MRVLFNAVPPPAAAPPVKVEGVEGGAAAVPIPGQPPAAVPPSGTGVEVKIEPAAEGGVAGSAVQGVAAAATGGATSAPAPTAAPPVTQQPTAAGAMEVDAVPASTAAATASAAAGQGAAAGAQPTAMGAASTAAATQQQQPPQVVISVRHADVAPEVLTVLEKHAAFLQESGACGWGRASLLVRVLLRFRLLHRADMQTATCSSMVAAS